MKKLFTLLLIVLSYNLSAQKGFYLKPTAGVGYGNRIHRAEFASWPIDKASGLSYKFMVMAGYGKERWKFEAGLGYLSQKCGYNGLPISLDPIVASKGYANTRYTTSYISLPLLIGYSIKLSDKVRLQPQAGLSLNYNMLVKARAVEYDVTGKKISDIPGFNFKPKVIEIAGNLSMPFMCSINKHITLGIGPSFVVFVTETKKLEIWKMMPFALMVDAGIAIKL